MKKQGSSYENIYTKEINDALFDQVGYDSKKQEEKAQVKKERLTVRRQLRAFGGLLLVGILAGAFYFINLDPANAGPVAIALAVFMIISFLIWLINR